MGKNCAYALLFYVTIYLDVIKFVLFLAKQSNIKMLAFVYIVFSKCDSIVVGIYD